ncbi:unnamed protein product [Rhodiola kirilowii]
MRFGPYGACLLLSVDGLWMAVHGGCWVGLLAVRVWLGEGLTDLLLDLLDGGSRLRLFPSSWSDGGLVLEAVAVAVGCAVEWWLSSGWVRICCGRGRMVCSVA